MPNTKACWFSHKNNLEECWKVMMEVQFYSTVTKNRLTIRKSLSTLTLVHQRTRRKILLVKPSARKSTPNSVQMSSTHNSKNTLIPLMNCLKELMTKCWSTIFMVNTTMLFSVSWLSTSCTSSKPSWLSSSSLPSVMSSSTPCYASPAGSCSSSLCSCYPKSSHTSQMRGIGLS